MTLHFYLERKQLKSPDRAIYCYIRGLEKGKTIILNTGEKINPDNWDKQKELAIEKGKNKYIGALELNDFLQSYKEEIKRTTRLHFMDNPDSDFESVKTKILERFRKNQKLNLSFFEALDLFIESRSRDLSSNSIRKFKTLKGHLKEYEKKEFVHLTFSKMDLIFYDTFLFYLLEGNRMVNNSAYKIIGLLKIFLNWAYERGINKYQAYKRFKIKEDKVEIVALTDVELKQLTNLNLKGNERLNKVRDLFLFGCYTGGRFSDLARINWTDLRDNTWFLRVKKTKDVLEIPLNKLALEILEKYKAHAQPLPRISNQKLNKYVKEVCELAGIKEIMKIVKYSGNNSIETTEPKCKLVTVHTARRTFITQSLLRGMKAEIVMSISGHKNFRTFKKYLDITRKDKEAEISKAWNQSITG
jgi:integrase